MWVKLSDDFYDHPKVMMCSLEAIGLWTRCASYVGRHSRRTADAQQGASNVGFVPKQFVKMLQAETQAEELVASGLWEEIDGGWAFHDWKNYQPTPWERRKHNDSKDPKKVQAGRKGGAASAHSRNATGAQQKHSPVPVPDSTSKEVRRDDVNAVCEAFNTSLEARDVKPKKPIPEGWLKEARLMLDKDGRTVEQIKTCCEWLVTDNFWSSNILSLPTLRKKYDQLRLKAKNQSKPAYQPVNDDPYAWIDRQQEAGLL